MTNVLTGQRMGQVSAEGPALVQMFERLRDHASILAQTTARDRRDRLRRLRRAILQRRNEIVRALGTDLGRPAFESDLVEVHHVLQEIKHAMRHLPRWMRSKRARTPVLLLGTSSKLTFEPRGVVVILAPWNYPFSLVMNPLVAALAAGNCAVLKPSEKTPATAEVIASLVAEACDPAEVAVVQGGADVARALLDLPFDHVFFTGSTRVGKLVMAQAAQHLASVTLELGGKSPAIVDASANVVAAAERIVWGKFVNAGQTCIAPDFVLVHASVEAPLIDAIRRAIARFYPADGDAGETPPDFAPVIDDEHFQRLVSLTERTVASGARVEAGGSWDAATRIIHPTVLSRVEPDAAIMREEIFGPVLPVLTYEDVTEAVALVRRTGKPLASYVFARDKQMIDRVLKSFSAGATTVNNTLLTYASPALPFGGVGSSGVGSYHGYHGFVAFSHARPIVRQREPALSRLFFPPYHRRAVRFMLKLLRWLE